MYSFVSVFSAVALILFVLLISLLFMLAEECLLYKRSSDREGVKEKNCRISYKLGSDGHLPKPLFAACLTLLAVFLFIPMGSLPQFISTPADLFIVAFLLLSAHALYMKGIKIFSKDRYQLMEIKEINSFFYFVAVLLIIGGTLSWYVLNRGMPGNIFSIDAYSAMFLWLHTGYYGKVSLALFFFLLAVESPSRERCNFCESREITLSDMFEAVFSTVGAAIITAIFLPHKYALGFGITGTAMFSVDFLFFWAEVFALQTMILPFIKRLYFNFMKSKHVKFRYLPGILACVLGVILMLIDLYF